MCGAHVRFQLDSAACSSCVAAEETARKEAIDRSVLGSTGLRQIVEALHAGGLTTEGFNRFRSLGVNFKTNTPWDEVKRLYRDHPIDTRGGIQYHLKIRTTTPIIGGSKETSHSLPAIPAVRVAVQDSEGYVRGSGLLTADGTVLKTISGPGRRQVHLSESHYQGPVSDGIGLSPMEARRVVNSYRREIELRIQQDQSVRLSDGESAMFMGQMLAIWRQDAPGTAR